MEERIVKVYIKTPARLHLGLIDMNGDLGRLFGGLGLGIDHPNVILEAQRSNQLIVSGEKAEQVKALAKKFLEIYHVQANVNINVKQTIPDHVGLGSGTQLALAVATALQKLFHTEATTQELAVAMGRAQRTSVGTTIFEQGGFVVDGGKSIKNGKLLPNFPPLIFRRPFPSDWRFVVAVPNANKGLSNDEEKSAFNQVQPMSAEAVGKISRLIIMKLLPGLMEHNIQSFGEALSKIQMAIGDNFASVQAGRYSCSIATECIELLRKLRAYGTGQSSWGPAIYGLFQEQEAKEAQRKVRKFLQDSVGGKVFTAKANNKGAYIRVTR